MRGLGIPTLVAALAAASVAAPAAGQDIQYTTVGKVELGGALGTVAKLFGAGDETSETTYIKGGMIRTDSDESSSILDLENGRVISIDHERKTYTIMTFAQMARMMDQAMTEAKEEAAQQSGAAAPPEAADPEAEVDLTYEMDIQATGEKQKINGYEAERVFMTMETEATVTEEGGEAQKAGRLVVFMDMWNSENVPVADAMAEFYRQAPELAAKNRQGMQNMAAVFASKPELESAMEEASKEAQEMNGFTLRSTTYMVLVPPDVEFDRDAVLNRKKESGGTAKKALGGLLRGALGAKEEEKPAEEAPSQAIFATMFSETKDMKTTSLPGDLFQPPAGYAEVQLTPPARS